MMKAVIFDMDGVLVDSEPLYFHVNKQIFKSLGFDMEMEEYGKYTGAPAYAMWEDLKPRFALSQSIEELIELERGNYYRYLCEQRGKLAPIAGVKTLLQKIAGKGIKMGIASSSDHKVIMETVASIGLKKYFEVFITTDMVVNGKPNPDIFIYAAGQLGVRVADCLVIEDSHNGVRAAKAAGMKVVGYLNPHSGNQDLSMADMLVQSFIAADLESMLQNV